MQFLLRSTMLTVAAVLVVIGGLETGSVFSVVAIVAITAVTLTYLMICSLRNHVRFKAFSFVCAAVGWSGLILSLLAPFPISGVPLWRSMYWSVTEYAGWFGFTGSGYLAIVYILQALFVGVAAGVGVELSFCFVRKRLKQKSNPRSPLT